jgi:hypothetical protein
MGGGSIKQDIGGGLLKLDITFFYHCCVRDADHAHIQRVLNRWPWHNMTVNFSERVCAIHGVDGRASLVLMLDDASKEKLELHAGTWQLHPGYG